MLSFSSFSATSPLSYSCHAVSSLVENAPLKPNWLPVSVVQSSKQNKRTKIRVFDRIVLATGLIAALLFLRAIAGTGSLRDADTLRSDYELASSARFPRQWMRSVAEGNRENSHEHHYVDADGLYIYSIVCEDDHTAFAWGWLNQEIRADSSAELDIAAIAET